MRRRGGPPTVGRRVIVILSNKCKQFIFASLPDGKALDVHELQA